MNIWLNPSFINYNVSIDSSRIGNPDSWKRPYEHLNHVEHLLTVTPLNEFHRIDIITTLKRSINHRLQNLNRLYQWKDIPCKLPKGELQKLEMLGVVKKQMVLRLFEISNAVEHDDKNVPVKSVCEDFLEFTWYFLRSTDHWIINTPHHIRFKNDNDIELTVVEINPQENWNIKILKNKTSENISLEYEPNWIKAELLNIRKRIYQKPFYCLIPELTDEFAKQLIKRNFFEKR